MRHRFRAPIAYFSIVLPPCPATRLVWLVGCALLLFAANAYAGQVTLAWDAVSAANLSGYRLYYGQKSHTYTTHLDVGLQPSATVTGLTAGQTYYFAVTALDSTGKEGALSNEVSTTITAPAPVANFSASPSSGQPPLKVTFTDASTGSITARVWNFGDGTNSTQKSPSHTYSTVGTYTVQLTVTGPGGSSTATGSITVIGPPPVANFSATPTSGPAALPVTFSDTSTGGPTGWAWSFGDGTGSTLQSPSHTYSTAGTYTVQLTATNTGGSNTTTKTGYVTVTVPPPVASFSATPTSGPAALPVTFSDTSTGGPTGWAWSFGDGTNSTLQSPSHTYSTAGTYTVQLTATNTGGSNTTTKTGYVTVTVPPPVASFSATPTSGPAALPVTFSDTSTGGPTGWAWSFGDGTNSTLQSPSHTYSTAGTYTVQLTATNTGGSNTATKTSYVSVTAPVPTTGQVTLAWDAVSASNLAGYRLYDGQTSHTYTTHLDVGLQLSATVTGLPVGQTYYFAVTAVDSTGQESPLSNEVSVTIGATGTAPVAAFSASPTSGPVALPVTFSDASTGGPTAWTWDFGDGTSSTLQSPSHTYATAGTYTAQLTAANTGGSNTATGSITVTALPPPPVANFSATPTSGPAALPVTFSDASTGSPTAWTWDFGDGTSSTLQSPSHTYSTAGTYTVQLTATNTGGSNTATKTSYVSVTAPVPTTGQVTLAWDAVSASNLAGYRLYDGQTSHTYTTHLDVGLQLSATVTGLPVGQTYYFAVTAVDSTGQESPLSNEVSVTIGATGTAPVAAFSASPTSTSHTATKTASSTANASPSPTSTSHTATKTASSSAATLASSLAANVSASQTSSPTPAAATFTQASFSAQPTSGRLPLKVAFSDTSTGSPTAWAWDFGDGTSSTQQSPTHTYATAGAYTVQLTATNSNGSNTATKKDYITVAPALLEVGDLTIDYVWQRVTFRQTFVDPIVVATPLSANDFTPATVRIRNVGPTGFEIRIQESDYFNGIHAPETVSYLAMERGPHVLGTGIRVEAGRLTTDETLVQPFAAVTFGQAFSVAPVVLSAVTSVHDGPAVTMRLRNITPSSFEVAMQQLSNSPHNLATETIDYIAWEPSSGTVDGLTFEVKTTPDIVTDNLYTLPLMEHFLAVPMFLAAMQTTANWTPTILRLDDKDPVEVHIQLEEEATVNAALHHPAEVVGYMAFTYQ